MRIQILKIKIRAATAEKAGKDWSFLDFGIAEARVSIRNVL
jgi:hypothetical protein